MSCFTVTIQGNGGAFLSCNADQADRTVTTRTTDDKSGRQRWVLTPSGVGPDSYVVTVSGGRGSGARVLSCTADSGVVDLYTADDGSGRQRWLLKPVAGKTRVFTASVEAGLNRPARKFLTLDGDKKLSLKPRLAAAAAASQQQFTVLEVAAPVPVLPTGGKAAVFLGGAFQATQQDLASNPGGWPKVAARAGYWLHPMGMGLAKDQGWLPQLLSRFAVKQFVYEQDLLAWSDGSNPVQTSTPSCWADWLRQTDPSFQCLLYAPWVAGDRLAVLLDDTTNRYCQIRQLMDAAGYGNKGCFFYAPPCPESIANADTLLGSTRNGMCHVEYVVRTARLRGVAIDFPASLWLSKVFPPQFPAGTGDRCRALAKQAHDAARRCGVPFVWVFNGADTQVAKALAGIKRAGMTVDVVGVDNFAVPSRPGTPETDPSSVSGQALSVLKWTGVRRVQCGLSCGLS